MDTPNLDKIRKIEKPSKLDLAVMWFGDEHSVNEEDDLKDAEAAATELLRARSIELAAIAVCKSFECYTAMKKPESEWDEYDYMMLPLWKKLVEVLGINPTSEI